MGDEALTFSQSYPEILEPFVSETHFRDLINHVNATLIRAFSPWRPRAWFDAGMGLLTGWLWDDLGAPAVKRELAELENWIIRWNKNAEKADGVEVIPLRRTAYLSLDIQIPDDGSFAEADLLEAERQSTVRDKVSCTVREPEQSSEHVQWPDQWQL